jgi:hypothetical protein
MPPSIMRPSEEKIFKVRGGMSLVGGDGAKKPIISND